MFRDERSSELLMSHQFSFAKPLAAICIVGGFLGLLALCCSNSNEPQQEGLAEREAALFRRIRENFAFYGLSDLLEQGNANNLRR